MKKCVVISDSFKGTLSSLEICAIARESVPRFFPDCQVVALPVADGGEGTVDCFVEAIGAERVGVEVSGPLGEKVQAAYARKGKQAVVEMAAAAGLPLAGPGNDPERATTFGVGQLIRHAVENGCTEILLGLGGSATNDGGCGCAAALGARFYDRQGRVFVPVGGTLDQIVQIDLTEVHRLLDGVRLTVMCDVKSPLYGPHGAAYVFAPQKGADREMVARLDDQLRAFDRTLQRQLGRSVAQIPGAGAAGGMGGGCVALLGAQLKPGIEAVLDLVDFDRHLEGADLVITGEGRLDSQSLQGKVVSGVAERTRAGGVPLVAIVGGIAEGAEAAYDLGVTAIFGIDREAVALDQAAPKTRENYRRTLEDILRLIRALERK
jgi:glycerate kinase